MATLVVFLYYVLAYCPDVDPFSETTQTSDIPEYHPNPFDMHLLSSRVRRQHNDTYAGSHSPAKYGRIRVALTEVTPSRPLPHTLSLMNSVYADHERPTTTYGTGYHDQWLCATALWYIDVSLGKGREHSLVRMRYTSLLPDLPPRPLIA
jgi:hypothetical protein